MAQKDQKIVSPPICWKCKKSLMEKLCENEIGGDYEYETFKYRSINGTIKINYCCLVCQMEMASDVTNQSYNEVK